MYFAHFTFNYVNLFYKSVHFSINILFGEQPKYCNINDLLDEVTTYLLLYW